MIERPSARLILLDPQDRLFLFNVHDPKVFDPANPFFDPFWVMIGKDVLHKERFFLARSATTEVDTSGLDERERSWTRGHRWWTQAEIEASPERFEPLDLGLRLKALLRDGPTGEPITLG